MGQNKLFDFQEKKYLTISEASQWASNFLNRNITKSNISYLIQYGKLKKYTLNGNVVINLEELKSYYNQPKNFEKTWAQTLGEELNWRLSFSEYKESERTKHVHRLHPYKGKFIPQLVEYFLDNHTYPKIAELAGMKIVNQYKRPVLNRVEKIGRLLIRKLFFI